MRNAFQRALSRCIAKNPDVMLLTGDLGYSVFEPIRDNFPKQYLNVGVAEQDLMGISAGLALSGKIVFAYSIATFASLRAFEQVRNDIAYQNLPVRIVGTGAGLSYGHLGVTHYALEDLAIMRSLSNMAVVAPVDPNETEAVIEFAIRHPGPMYIRLGKAGEKNIFKKVPKFSLGKFSVVAGGNANDVAIFGTGPLATSAIDAAALLRAKGVGCRVIVASSIKPIDVAMVKKVARECRLFVSLEEHSVIGGLGSALAEVLTENGWRVPLIRLGVPDIYPKVIGSQDYLRDQYGLSSEKIAGAVLRRIKRK